MNVIELAAALETMPFPSPGGFAAHAACVNEAAVALRAEKRRADTYQELVEEFLCASKKMQPSSVIDAVDKVAEKAESILEYYRQNDDDRETIQEGDYHLYYKQKES